MSAKKLDQSVFEGLPSEYRWAAVDECGAVGAYISDPSVMDGDDQFTVAGGHYIFVGDCYDTTDWQDSKIERQDVLTAADIDWAKADIDWANAPEGATHWHDGVSAWYKVADDRVFYRNYRDVWVFSAYEISDVNLSQGFITRPESITDVARSIEAARVAEQSERAYPHYFKDVSDVDAIDLYHVARLYDITDPALFHAFKKIACAGKRGTKDQAQDVQEAIDALKRWQELSV